VADTAMASQSTAPTAALTSFAMRYRTVDIDGIKIFYREAGDPARPTILLLHGFPSSSHMYRDLIPLLAPHFHVVAPDYPGFGNSDAPAATVFEPTFANLAVVMEHFVEKLELGHFVIYMQDFGGPVGFRMAVKHPQSIDGFVIQNANAYLEGLSVESIKSIRSLDGKLTPEGKAFADSTVEAPFTKFMYHTGVRNEADLDPGAWKTDLQALEGPDNKRIQRSLIVDYHTNLDLYPAWQAYLKKYQPPALIVWGKNDRIFLQQGAEAYKRDLPRAQVYFFDTGHFALEEDAAGIADKIIQFYDGRKK
jgi:pimeloyl-ACP methyl ester carboxylesterase